MKCRAVKRARHLDVRLILRAARGVAKSRNRDRLALGLAGSLWAARFVEALLFQLEARDPVTFAGAAAVLLAVGVPRGVGASPTRGPARSGDGAAGGVGALRAVQLFAGEPSNGRSQGQTSSSLDVAAALTGADPTVVFTFGSFDRV
jgi:hypothetical protein